MAACTVRGEYTGGSDVPPQPQPDSELSFEIINPTGAENAVGILDGNEFTVTIPNSWGKTSLYGRFTLPRGVTVEPNPEDAPLDYTGGQTFALTKETPDGQDPEDPVEYTVVVQFQYSTVKAITDFSIDGRAGSVDQDTNTIHVTLAYSTSPVGSYTPDVVIEDDKASYAPQGEVNFSSSASVPVDYTVTDEAGEDRVYRVSVTRAPNFANKITAFSVTTTDQELLAVLSSMPAPVISDGTPGSIVVTIPAGMSKTFTPSITHEGVSISPASGVEQNFSTTQSYTVTAANTDTRVYNVSVNEASRATANCTAVTSNSTTPGTATSYLTLTFNTAVPTLKAENISLSASDGSITKGALTVVQGTDYKTWRLAVSNVSKNNLSVSVGKISDPVGFTLGSLPQDVTVQSSIFQFQSLTASGSPVTNELTLTFDAAVPGLSESNLSLTATGGTVTKGTLSHQSGGVYKLGVSAVSVDGVSARIDVAKSPYTFQPADRSVALKGPILFTSVTADGTDDVTTTTKLTLQFNQDVSGGLTAADITLDPALTKGTVTAKGSGEYELAITGGIPASGVSVAVTPAKSDWAFTPASRNVTVYKQRPTDTTTFNATGAAQSWSAPHDGVYKIELWGAQGGEAESSGKGGKGGYTYGNIRLTQGDALSFYVGKKGVNRSGTGGGAGGWNGGGKGGNGNGFAGGGGGGGATDVRQGGAEYDDRIMVAGGGGGASYTTLAGGAGGGGNTDCNGGNGAAYSGDASAGATQSSGNARGVGQNGRNSTGGSFGGEGNGGGGGGYWGGWSKQAGSANSDAAGGGGSSYAKTPLFTNVNGTRGGNSAADGKAVITWVDW